jgi:hypothetical protein
MEETMSNIYDANKKLVNKPGYGTTNGKGECRYADTGCTEIDWFATHPRPVEKNVVVAPPVEPKAAVVEKTPFVLFPVETPITPVPLVKVLETEKGTLVFKGEDGTKIQATTPLAPLNEAPVNATAPSNNDVPSV